MLNLHITGQYTLLLNFVLLRWFMVLNLLHPLICCLFHCRTGLIWRPLIEQITSRRFMRRHERLLRSKARPLLLQETSPGSKFYFSLEIWFGYICARIDFQDCGTPSCSHVVLV